MAAQNKPMRWNRLVCLSLKSLFTPWSRHVVEPSPRPQRRSLVSARLQSLPLPWERQRSQGRRRKENSYVSVSVVLLFTGTNPVSCLWARWASLAIQTLVCISKPLSAVMTKRCVNNEHSFSAFDHGPQCFPTLSDSNANSQRAHYDFVFLIVNVPIERWPHKSSAEGQRKSPFWMKLWFWWWVVLHVLYCHWNTEITLFNNYGVI